MKPSLSTMWMQHRADRVQTWWEQVQQVGFEQIELSHIVTPAMLEGFKAGDAPVSSVHFPAPTTVHPSDPRPADVLISCPEAALRRWAVDQARRSIDFAAEMGARAVCIHAGRVDIPERLEWMLYQRYLGGYKDRPIYRKTLTDILRLRAERAEPYFSAVRQSLTELAPYAQAAGVQLGIETRLHLYEIPNLEEARIILAEHDPAILGHWHDCGHVQVQAHLGVESQQTWLDVCGLRTVAVHFHDTRGLRDHLIPGDGDIDFSEVAQRIPNQALRVCELDWYFNAEELRSGVKRLASLGCCEPLASVSPSQPAVV